MSDISRRDVLRRLALTLTATGLIDRVAAAEVHLMAAQAAAGGTYAPKTFTAAHYRTLERLTDIIIPVEHGAPGAPGPVEHGAPGAPGPVEHGAPGAVAAGAAAWIDMISSENDELKTSYAKGFAWLDGAMKGRGAADFVSASPAQQTELLDLIAYRRNASPELTPGIEFFTLVRRMTVDAFYTSAIGIKDIDYRGNSAMASYPSPTESIAYALKRSPLG